MIYSSWDKDGGRLKLVIMGHFVRFYPLPIKNKKNQDFEKMKKIAGDITLHMGTKNHNHMRCGSSGKEWETKFFVILGYFLSFYLPNNLQNQNFEKMRRVSGDVIILHMYAINDNHMMYGSWDIVHNPRTDRKSDI